MRCLPLLALLVGSVASAQEEPKWLSLFNGKDLSGWTAKIANQPLGENYANTFRVDDGMIKVSYDAYPKFDLKFGHLFTNLAYSRYVLRMGYRFFGKMMPDAPKYVNLNSGIMLHAQPPQSMRFDQASPPASSSSSLPTKARGPVRPRPSAPQGLI